MFQKLVSQTELEKSLLYPYQHCAFNPLAATASILMMRNDHAYLDSLRVFLITFNEIHFFNQLKQAYANYQCFSRDSTQAFIPDRLGEVCHRVGQNVRHLQLVMCSHWKSSFNQPMFCMHSTYNFCQNPLTCLSQPLPEPQFCCIIMVRLLNYSKKRLLMQ